MWMGPGGVIAVLLAVWGWVWAARRTPARPREELIGTVAALVGLQAGLALVSAQAWLVIGYADVARGLSSPERAVLLDEMRSGYGPLAWGALSLGVLGIGVWRSSGRWAPSRQAPSLAAWIATLLIAGSVALSALSVLGFHVVFVGGGPEAVNRQGAMIASQVLLAGSVAAWFAIAVSCAWLAARGVAAARSARLG